MSDSSAQAESPLPSTSSAEEYHRPPYYTRTITRTDRCAVLNFLREYYFEDEPINAFLYRKLTRRYIDRGFFDLVCIDEGLSTLAMSRTGDIVGVALASTLLPTPDLFYVPSLELNPIFYTIKKLYDYLNKVVDPIVKVRNPGEKELNLRIICVHPEWRRKGIALGMLKQTKWIATYHNYAQIRSVCTSFYGEQLFKKFGFKVAYALKYENCRINGKRILPPSPHTELTVMVLKLDKLFV